MFESGEVVLAIVQFADTFEVKQRPAVVLFEEFGNVVIAGITSNTDMKGIPLSKSEGAVENSIIKTNYIFTVSEAMVKKRLFHLSKQKCRAVFADLEKKLSPLKS